MSDLAATAPSPSPSATPAAPPSDAPSSAPGTTAATTAPDGRDATLIGAPEAAAETKTDTQEPPATPPQGTAFDVSKIEFPPELGKPSEASLNKFAEIAKSLNLSQEGAQQLVGLHLDAIKSASEADRQSWSKTIETWENEIKADPKIGGEKWNETKASIAKLVLEPSPFATPGLIEALNLTGFGSNPAAVRFFAKIASAFSEGKAVTGSAPTQQAPRTAAQALYPTLPSEAR